MKQLNHNIEEKQITQLSAAFEARLYKCAPTLEFHRDCSTLESRVKLLALQLGQKLERRKLSQTISILAIEDKAAIFNSVERRSKLSFEDIREIVEKVKKLRKNGYIDMRVRENGDTTCHGLSCLFTSASRSPHTTCSNTKYVSTAMKNIYFRTRLVDAFDKLYRIQTKDGIVTYSRDVDWDMLIEEAKDSIYHYEIWERVQVQRLR
ncbi:predicted protein [Chaetoceros tenuissimus]|uniref:Uncharacterized protein n=1 Tax=Chaetoceros tenuissimus TaxID=426638 RepID=A0AAD3D3W6_9STRA|nr:predicted protein [Chaetoceros tenuissimus]